MGKLAHLNSAVVESKRIVDLRQYMHSGNLQRQHFRVLQLQCLGSARINMEVALRTTQVSVLLPKVLLKTEYCEY